MSKILLLCGLLLIGSGTATAVERIVALAPHATELVFALDQGDKLVGVSAHSDFPPAAQSIPVIGDHNGINFEAILRLQPDLVIAWQDGNKPQDLARLQSLGMPLFLSNPDTPVDIAAEIEQLGERLGAQAKARQLSRQLRQALGTIQQRWQTSQRRRVFYYLWPTPLMTINNDAWAGKLLRYCNASSLFDDAATAYPQVTVEQVVRRQPDIIISATNGSPAELQSFWSRWPTLQRVPVHQVNADKLHRFTPRLVNELARLCELIHRTH